MLFRSIELILVVAGLAIIFSVAAPFSNSSIVKGNTESAARTLELSLRRAYAYARAEENNSDWGVYVSGDHATVFSGSLYDGHDTSFDEVATLKTSPTLSGTLYIDGAAEVVFTKGTGAPSATGTIILSGGSITRTITINSASAILVE